jgi:hypothetical protein
MLARYFEGLCSVSSDGVALISGPLLHVLSLRVSDRLYAYASPTKTWAVRRPTVRRKDRSVR